MSSITIECMAGVVASALPDGIPPISLRQKPGGSINPNLLTGTHEVPYIRPVVIRRLGGGVSIFPGSYTLEKVSIEMGKEDYNIFVCPRPTIDGSKGRGPIDRSVRLGDIAGLNNVIVEGSSIGGWNLDDPPVVYFR